jgi:hypothetical protein
MHPRLGREPHLAGDDDRVGDQAPAIIVEKSRADAHDPRPVGANKDCREHTGPEIGRPARYC